MYKDKDRQKEANKQASQRRRDKAKGMTQSENVIPDRALPSFGLQEHCKKVYAKNFPKRGKDIKRFADLPLDVQQAIEREPADQKTRRTTAAIHYQHVFLDRY